MTKETFDLKYRGEKVAVHCDTEEKAKAFLSLAKSFGYVWANQKAFDEITRWEILKSNTCYTLDGHIVGFMAYGYDKAFKEEGYKIVEFELNEPKETFNVGDVVYVSEDGQDSQTYIIVRFENTAIIKNNSGGQKSEALSNLTHKNPLKEITEKELADMGFVLKK